MKKKLVYIAILMIISLYHFVTYFQSGKQKIEVSINQKYYTESNIEALVRVKDAKKDISKDGNLKVELLNSQGKKIKGIKQKYKLEEGKDVTVSIPLSKEIESGNYSLKLTATDGLLKDSKEIDVSVVNGTKENVIISLDKGIYKPGDVVNFRAMFLSKKDDTPISEDVTISIYDGNENRVFIEKTKSSEFGIISGKFELADEVNSGEYKIVVETKATQQTKIFNVNPYIIPTFEAKIATDKETYVIGETAHISLNAKYFFGEPVKNANIIGTINGKEILGLTDDNGNFNTTYKIEKVEKINLQLQVVDSSNYLVETEKTFFGSSDVFEIEVLPENNELIKGIDNDIYIFTKKADGTPVKTHTTIQFEKKSKQVITDENGIGKITLTASDINDLNKDSYYVNNYNNKQYYKNSYDYNYEYNSYFVTFSIKSVDMNENIVSKKVEISVGNNSGTTIDTDKVKYNQGEDIHITLSSSVDIQNGKIYVYKANELLKMISTDNTKVDLNLEDCYGLIDIYVDSNSNDQYVRNYYDSSYNAKTSHNKKTIFIKPAKELNVQIKTDAEEYKPGENVNIKFTTQNGSKENVDSALLVSILDEAILSLADNDLSIDNIKLALEDIEFVDGITAADIYTNIVNEQDEQLLMGLLLKQNKDNYNIQKISYTNREERAEDLAIAVATGLMSIAIIVIFVSVKAKKARKSFKFVFNFIVLFLICSSTISINTRISEVICWIIGFLIALIANITILYNKTDYIFKMIIDLIIFPFIAWFVWNVVYYGLDLFNEEILLIFLLLPPTIWAILVGISRSNTLKKGLEKLKSVCKYITKIEIIFLLISIISSIFNIYAEIAKVLLAIGVYIVCEKIYNKEKIEIKGKETIIFIVAIIVIVVVLEMMDSYRMPIMNGSYLDGGDATTESLPSVDYSEPLNESLGIQADGFVNSTTTKNESSILDKFGDLSFSADVKQDSVIETEQQIQKEEQTKNEEIEENVRNVFLESLAFIPELIAKQGNAEITIPLSDNITTWNIQTIGNTKQGDVGFGTSSFKVFKEFFIDFSLPTNSVVTDKISIPVTIYNYEDKDLKVELKVKENEWCTIQYYSKEVAVAPKETKLVYVPIEILKQGTHTLRIEAKTDKNIQDIVEKNLTVTPNGIEKTKVVSSGTIEKNYTQDFFTTEKAIENTRKLKVKIYPSMMAQIIEGMENIFRMPTGCFEQTSSSLYPNVLALKYLEENKLSNEAIKEKALEYISKGYQRLLSFEVPGEKGGYSLYGDRPAEPVITAFGLMEISDLEEVYEVEEKVINNMIEYLFKQQKSNGKFNYRSTYIGDSSSTDDLAMNAYIIWALSETCPKDKRLEKSVEYLEKNLSKVKDNYTRALIANVFSNTNHEALDEIISDLTEQIKYEGENAYISSNIRDYYGSYGRYQNIQTTALTSMVFSKERKNQKTNLSLINYIISQKDRYGTWGTTQSTVLALKAINDFNVKEDLSNQTISVKVNGNTKDIEIGENALDLYEVEFENIEEEAKISINMKKGTLTYEIVEEYYIQYEKLEENKDIKISQEITKQAKVNDIITQKIHLENLSEENLRNGLIQISIPQGCSTIEESLMQLKYKGIIEKYEYTYGKINLYFRNFAKNEIKEVEVKYRALYPENITGGSVICYDYYNPDIEGITKPININVTQK